MTPTQRKHLRKGARRITECANRAISEWYADYFTTVGTYYTVRTNRMFKGKPVGLRYGNRCRFGNLNKLR